jgi:hypothetical protein
MRVRRVEKRHERLDELERRLEERVLAELEQVCARRGSLFLNRRMTEYFDGRQYRSAEVGELEDLANEVIALKEKLREPVQSGVTGLILFCEELRQLPSARQPHLEERIDLARQKAEEFRATITGRASRS